MSSNSHTSPGCLFDERDELRLASLEAGMLELGRCRGSSLTDLAEAVEVKLTYERRPVAVSVHRRDDLPGEGLGVVDHKGVAVHRPAADLSRT